MCQVSLVVKYIYIGKIELLLSPTLVKKAKGILLPPPSVRLSVMISPPKPLDEIQPNLVCESIA